MGVTGTPALDEDAFERLRREIGDDGASADFVEIFLDLLPRRLHDLSTGMTSGQRPWETTTNLAATCRMLGARALAEHLEGLEEGAGVVASPCIDGPVDPANTLVFTRLEAAMAVFPDVVEWKRGVEGHWCARGTRWGDWDIHEAVLDHIPPRVRIPDSSAE